MRPRWRFSASRWKSSARPDGLAVCRSILGDFEHDAQDAFQATFLGAAHRAGSARDRSSVGVGSMASRCELRACARGSVVRRRRHERRAAELAPTSFNPAKMKPTSPRRSTQSWTGCPSGTRAGGALLRARPELRGRLP